MAKLYCNIMNMRMMKMILVVKGHQDACHVDDMDIIATIVVTIVSAVTMANATIIAVLITMDSAVTTTVRMATAIVPISSASVATTLASKTVVFPYGRHHALITIANIRVRYPGPMRRSMCLGILSNGHVMFCSCLCA